MDPFSIILAFSAALAASAAVQVHQQSKQSGYDRAWMDYIGLNQGTMTPQQLVDADRAMEQGELPPGHIWIDENTAIPQDALLDMQSAAFDATSGENLIGLGETFDFGILPTDEEASRRMLRYFAPHADQVRWVKQLSGHDARGEWKTLLFSKPLPVRFPRTPSAIRAPRPPTQTPIIVDSTQLRQESVTFPARTIADQERADSRYS